MEEQEQEQQQKQPSYNKWLLIVFFIISSVSYLL
jgi:hypothetical protein